MAHRLTFVLLAWCLVALPARASTPPPSDDPFPAFDVRVYAEGLQQPDGLAIHPVTHELYVSEETAGRVSVIRNGRAVPVIAGPFTVKDDVPDWLLTQDQPRSFWTTGQLHSPEGIAFAPDGHLYVVEDSPRGRVLQFASDAGGRYGAALVVPVPRLGEPYAWESICFAHDGRLFLAGSSFEAAYETGSGCVLSRDATQGWWVVDSGSFAAFSAVTMSADEDILVAADESVGGLTWWDAMRHRELQTLVNDLGTIEGICNLPDGSLAVAQEQTRGGHNRPANRTAGGRLLRVNPANGAIQVIADGLGSIESVVCDEQTGRLYVSEDSTGRILCLTPRTPYGPRHALLQVAQRGGEAQHGLPPRQVPGFLKQFMHKVGVNLVDHGSASSDALSSGATRALTLEELGRHVPLVAGRVRVEAMDGVADPITEVSFINLFPNQMTHVDQNPTPSVCLYAARHRSGRVDRSQSLAGLHARKLNPGGGAEELSQATFLMLPLATCSAVEDDNGVTVTMSFLGLERNEDCFLTMNYGRRNEAFFATSGDKLRVARATFAERRTDGSEILNFAMTGFSPRRAEDATWLRIGTSPNFALLSPSIDVWVSRWTLAQMPDLVKQMRRYNRDVLDSTLDASIPDLEYATRQRKTPGPQLLPPGKPTSSPADSADRKPITSGPPLASIRFPPPPVSDEDNLLTNLILSRIVQHWEQGGPERP